MFSPDERKLITAILALLLLGGMVKSCRNRVVQEQIPKADIPAVESVEAPDTSPD